MALEDSQPWRRDWIIAAAVGLAAFIVYLRTLAPTVLPADSGELQFAVPLLGLVHPTGYPFYLLLGKLWTLLVPLGDIAYRMNLLSAVLSAMTVSALFVLCRRLELAVLPCAAAALILAFSRTFWSQAVRAEVYALNSLFTVLLLVLAVHAGQATEQRLRRYALYALLFTLGLALTHHRTAILLIPALVVLASQQRPEARNSQPGTRSPEPGAHTLHPVSWITYLVVFLAPLLLYLLIPWRAAAAPYLRLAVGGGPDLVLYHNTLGDLLALVMGNVFRGSLGLAAGTSFGERVSMAGQLLWQNMGPALIFAAIGLISILRARPRIAFSLALAYAAVAGFCLVYFIGDVAELFTPSYVVIAVCAGAGLDALASLRRPESLKASDVWSVARALAIAALGAILAGVLLVSDWRGNDLSGETATRRGWEALLRQPLPQGAVLVSNDRDEMTPMWYLQYVDRVRPDLVGLFPKITPEPQFAAIGGLLDWLLVRGQQPYLIKPMPGLEVKYALQPGAGLTQVTGFAAPSPLQPDRSVHADFAGRVELAGVDVQGALVPGSAMTVTLYWTPLAPISENDHVFVQLMTPAGDRVLGSDHRPGGDYYPTSLWAAGDVLVDHHILALPALLPPGTYSLKAGMYRYPSLARLELAGTKETMADLGTVQIR